ncbi:phage tail tube protein [Vibrio parahaemolyticus]|uniref:phage tail tube protein n=1 Tax=Vibrio campbellii TaxID=680 RepID=UPI0015DC2E9D|nr:MULTISPECIES: phage tail tube protein [Vibrio harveyi group]MCE7729227.1 phage tail tube protein [Vibrio campbellii]MCR9657267.1 phage tail tube protein [Vibrio parahaemolyticus]QLK44266.1 hypothetical protein DR996_02490 [Vibrio owensii]
MGNIVGEATIRVNGKKLRSMGGAELDLGGKENEAVVGSGQVWGHKTVYKAPNLSLKIAAHADTNFKELNDLEYATVDFDANNGLRFLINNAFRTETVKISEGDGSFSLSMSGDTAEQV